VLPSIRKQGRYMVARAQHVEKGDTLKQGTPTTSGIQLMLFINESGLYSLILSSKMAPVSPFSAKSQRTKTESQPFQYGKTL
jgi:prophage antirepressor-like protein